MTAVFVVALGVYALSSICLFVFGANLSRFAFVAWRGRRSAAIEEPPVSDLPTVTVQLPIYNELYVAERIIEAACLLDYPRDRLQIQVLDDSDDETSAVVADAVRSAREAGADIVHLQRVNRAGYKAGALAAGLEEATGSLIAIFDADFVPPPDFLLRTVPHFGDRSVAFVQGRWGHLNGDYSWLTQLQVPAIDGHFLVEQQARGRQGHWFNFNGTAGIWRASAITDAGGWQHDTLTEDLDLSYRAHLRGWRGVYLPDLVVPGEVPAQLSGFRRQQHRWARGSLECAMKLLGPIWASDARPGVKFQATMHLLAYTIHLLLIAVLLSYPFVLLAGEAFGMTQTLWGLGYVLTPASLSPAIFLATGQALQGRGGRRRAPAVAAMIVFGSGLMVNTARAALDIVTRPDPVFERTAKYGLAEGPTAVDWASQRYQRQLDRVVYFEVALGLYGLGTAYLAYSIRSWGIFLYAMLFAAGLLAVAGASIAQAGNARRRRRGGLVRRSRSRDPVTTTP